MGGAGGVPFCRPRAVRIAVTVTGGPWDAYWRDFEALRSSLAGGAGVAAARDLEEAKVFVNGLTDGWADHLAAMRLARGRHRLSPAQAKAWKRLEAAVEQAVRRR